VPPVFMATYQINPTYFPPLNYIKRSKLRTYNQLKVEYGNVKTLLLQGLAQMSHNAAPKKPSLQRLSTTQCNDAA
jgi:hypothetical protein